MKRFYTSASAIAVDGGHAVLLDNRQVKTPARALLQVPTGALADAIVAEWMAQTDELRPASMPLTGMANAAIDLISPDPRQFALPLAAYAESDLLCYRAPETDLAALEAQHWNPLLAWAENRFAVEFSLATGVMHVAQPEQTLALLRDALLTHTPFQLAAMAPLITIGGSLVVALALSSRAFDADTLWTTVALDELWQEERWGADDDARATRALKQREWAAADRFLTLLD